MKFSIKDFFSKCDQIRRKLGIWSHLLKKSLMENFIFRAVIEQKAWFTDQMKWRGSIESSMAVINKKSIQCNNIIIGVKCFSVSIESIECIGSIEKQPWTRCTCKIEPTQPLEHVTTIIWKTYCEIFFYFTAVDFAY